MQCLNDILRDRAVMFKSSRDFFERRGIIEVDTPILTSDASIDVNIDLIMAHCCNGEERYLISSPEYAMKRLLAQGARDIYQLSHVFRDEEYGAEHNPEFMMAEWYRPGFSFQQMFEETVDFVNLFLGDVPHEVISYREAIENYVGIDYVTATDEELLDCIDGKAYDGIMDDGRDAILNVIMGTIVEPNLGKDCITVLTYYPASQAALAQTCYHDDEHVAERFEVYYQGSEFANGYHELADSEEQRRRFVASNDRRIELGRGALPIDERFLHALESLPDCCGVAVGFDRLMMKRHKKKELREVLAFPWV